MLIFIRLSLFLLLISFATPAYAACAWTQSGDYVCGATGAGKTISAGKLSKQKSSKATKSVVNPIFAKGAPLPTQAEMPELVDLTESPIIAEALEDIETLDECSKLAAEEALSHQVEEVAAEFPNDPDTQATALNSLEEPLVRDETAINDGGTTGPSFDALNDCLAETEVAGEALPPITELPSNVLTPLSELVDFTGIEVTTEAESVAATGDWQSYVATPGFTGTEAYRYTGGNLYGGPSASNDLTYTVNITKPGRYLLDIRSMRNPEQENIASDLENDYWVSADGSPPKKQFFHGGFGTWQNASTQEEILGKFKVYQHPVYYFDAGVHTVTISARSEQVIFDGFRLREVEFKDGSTGPLSGPVT